MDVKSLNEKFGISGRISIEEGQGGLPVVCLKGTYSTAKVCLLGAHVMSWCPAGGQDALWMSDKSLFTVGKAIRGGIPVCWPWFSKHPTNESFPMHGFARIMMWELANVSAEAEDTVAVFELETSEESLKMFPGKFRLRLTVRAGKELTLQLKTINVGEEAFTITQALHTYYNVGDITKVTIEGFDGLTCLDKVNNGVLKVRHDPFVIDCNVDEVYGDAPGAAVIHDAALDRDINISKEGSGSAVVWNPWIEKSISMADFPDDGYKTMLCVETANVADDKRTIQPGMEHSLTMKVRVR